ncbi:unnamed protein product, partial [Sphacelaria rigidula]
LTPTHVYTCVSLVDVSAETTGVLNKGTDGICNAGDEISYTMVTTNTGNTCLRDVEVTDTISGSTCIATADLCPQDPIMTCIGTYTIDQADIDSGSKSNTGTAISLSPAGASVGDTNEDRVLLTGIGIITLGISGKWTDGAEGDGLANIGETISRTYTISNDGTTTLYSICIIDGGVGDQCVDCDDELAPGAETRCEVTSLVSSS